MQNGGDVITFNKFTNPSFDGQAHSISQCKQKIENLVCVAVSKAFFTSEIPDSDHIFLLDKLKPEVSQNTRPLLDALVTALYHGEGILEHIDLNYGEYLANIAYQFSLPYTWDRLGSELKKASLRLELFWAWNNNDLETAFHHWEQLKKHSEVGLWESPVNTREMILVPPDPMPWFIKDNIPLGRGIVISGLGGSSKTRLLYQLAIGGITGTLPWDWEVVTTGKALLVLTEDTAEDVHRTIWHIGQVIDLTDEQIEIIFSSLYVFAMAGQDVKLLKFGQNKELVKTEQFYSLEDKIKSIGQVAFVGLDPALSLTDGDEMDQSHQRQLGKMADDLAVKTGATVALITHATKASQNQDELASHSSRGAGGITDAVRGEFAMRTMTAQEATKAGIEDIEERKRHVQLVGTKGNNLPPAAYVPLWLRREERFGLLIGADITLDKGGSEPNKTDLEALGVLKEMSKRYTPALKEWRGECINRGIIKSSNEEAAEKAMERIVRKLRKSGYIEKGHGRGIYKPIEQTPFGQLIPDTDTL
jgi:hypothetical protein